MCKVEKATISMAAKGDQPDKENTFYGPQVQMGNGKARSFTTITHSGVPKELGMEITKGALSGFPDDHALAAFTLPRIKKLRQPSLRS
ncbi:MAG: hypothetical protein WKF70_04720 [Chitinophagaceae bacterium]